MEIMKLPGHNIQNFLFGDSLAAYRRTREWGTGREARISIKFGMSDGLQRPLKRSRFQVILGPKYDNRGQSDFLYSLRQQISLVTVRLAFWA